MGISTRNFDFLQKCLNYLNCDIKKKYILELGNQHIRGNLQRKFKIEQNTGKEYFEFLGCNHYSIDINGKDGAISIDLSKKIENSFWYNKFDIITNFGTIEHVCNGKEYGQWEAWRNIHKAGKIGSFYIHSIPYLGSWPTHCNIHYDQKFFENLSKYHDYDLIYNEINKLNTKKTLLHAFYIKRKDIKFIKDKDIFTSWIEISENDNNKK